MRVLPATTATSGRSQKARSPPQIQFAPPFLPPAGNASSLPFCAIFCRSVLREIVVVVSYSRPCIKGGANPLLCFFCRLCVAKAAEQRNEGQQSRESLVLQQWKGEMEAFIAFVLSHPVCLH